MVELLLGLVVIFAVVFFLYGRREGMTNKDLLTALKTYGVDDKPAAKKSTDTKDELPIYGPKGVPSPPQPKPSSPSKSNGSSYPEIYGPDIVLVPGKPANKNGNHPATSDDSSTYEYNPDLKDAFPTDGAPQPFLNDFSKFQR